MAPPTPVGGPPMLTLSNGVSMPMVAVGTGNVRSALPRRRGGRRARAPRGALLAMLNVSFGVGFRHLDTSEVYPLHDEVGEALDAQLSVGALTRANFFVTSKVDPTRRPGRPSSVCRPDGSGCFAAMLAAANSTVQRMRTHVDLLLLHRPPKREGDAKAQCARLRESWRGLEDAYARGLARAIGLSNVCSGLLRCLAASAKTAPHVVQYMLHVGMGPDPYGYRAWVKAQWGAAVMAYSVLGGVEGDFGRITSQPTVQRIAAAHRTGGANVALSWVAQLGVPLIVLSTSAAHLRDDLSLFGTPPWGRLSEGEMRELSSLRNPPGRPSHWGDCVDTRLG